MSKLTLALLALALCSSMVWAGPPYPPNCTVSADACVGVILCPDIPAVINQSIIFMTIRDEGHIPCPGVPVTIQFGSGPLCFCPTMQYTTTTDYLGRASLTLRGGGCLRDVDQAAVIRANGLIIRDYQNAKSPDWDGMAGNCTVNLGDVVRFVNRDPCFDFCNDGTVDIADFVIFGSGYTPSHWCP